jgi:ABC-type transporter Mla maintaining outer membrane lipid asymmetry permease subunit MlaE
VISSLTSAFSASLVAGFSLSRWRHSYFGEVGLEDVRFILLKTLISGFLVAVSTYHLAMGPKHSGRAVGESVNFAIVGGMLTVLAVHGLLTIWQFA